MRRRLLNALLYAPSRTASAPPPGLDAEQLEIDTADGERLHGWRIGAMRSPRGHILYCHGNGGTLIDRASHARLLAAAEFDVLLFDYRGYGRSTGRPNETGTHLDARAARQMLLRQPGVDHGRLLYLGESLGGAVALALALESPPAGLILQSAFTSVRDVARVHYPFIPRAVVPDAYPSLRRIAELGAPLLVLHGQRDEIVPSSHGQALFAAAPEPKRLEILAGVGHDDLLPVAGDRWLAAISEWANEVLPRP